MEFCPEYNICTDPVTSGSHLCEGDSGSPLYEKACTFARKPLKVECLMGVASYYHSDKSDQDFNRPNNDCNSGSYFTSIPYFYEWIAKTIENYVI